MLPDEIERIHKAILSFEPYFLACEPRHRLKQRSWFRLQARFLRLEERLMTQVSDGTCMAIYSIAITLLALSWVYVPA